LCGHILTALHHSILVPPPLLLLLCVLTNYHAQTIFSPSTFLCLTTTRSICPPFSNTRVVCLSSPPNCSCSCCLKREQTSSRSVSHLKFYSLFCPPPTIYRCPLTFFVGDNPLSLLSPSLL